MLIEKLTAPGSLCVAQQGRETFALHALRRINASGIEDGRSEVNIERQSIVRAHLSRSANPWIAHNQGNANAFLVRIPFIGKTVLTVEVAIVSRENHQGIFPQTASLEFGHHRTANLINFAGKTIVIFHHRLIFFGSVKAPGIAVATFIFFAHEK